MIAGFTSVVSRFPGTAVLIILMLVTQFLQIRVLANLGPVWEARLFVMPNDWWTQPWTVVTSVFAHSLGPGWHLERNLVTIAALGPAFEARWGARALMRYFVVAGAVVAVISMAFRYGDALGASGAAYALIGPAILSLVGGRRHGWLAPPAMLACSLLGLVAGLDVLWNPSHLFGFLVGWLWLTIGLARTSGPAGSPSAAEA